MTEETVITSFSSIDFANRQCQLAKEGWRIIPGTIVVTGIWDEKAQIDRWQYVAFFSREHDECKGNAICDGWSIDAHGTDATTEVFVPQGIFYRPLNLCAECLSRRSEDMAGNE